MSLENVYFYNDHQTTLLMVTPVVPVHVGESPSVSHRNDFLEECMMLSSSTNW